MTDMKVQTYSGGIEFETQEHMTNSFDMEQRFQRIFGLKDCRPQ